MRGKEREGGRQELWCIRVVTSWVWVVGMGVWRGPVEERGGRGGLHCMHHVSFKCSSENYCTMNPAQVRPAPG